MLELYPHIKWIHVASVAASGGLFLLRGIAVQGGGRWAMAAPVRYLSYGIDTVLLAAGIALAVILPAGAFANGWLAAKLALLVVYIVLGSLALKRGRTPRVRLVCFVAAVLTFLAIVSIARAHHPLGPVWMLLR